MKKLICFNFLGQDIHLSDFSENHPKNADLFYSSENGLYYLFFGGGGALFPCKIPPLVTPYRAYTAPPPRSAPILSFWVRQIGYNISAFYLWMLSIHTLYSDTSGIRIASNACIVQIPRKY